MVDFLGSIGWRFQRAARAACFLLILTGGTSVRGEEPNDDPFLRHYATTYRFTLGQPTSIRISDAGDVILFLRSGPESFVRDLFEYDVTQQRERRLLSAEQLLGGGDEQLSAEELARRERMRLAARGIASFDMTSDGRQVLVPLSGTLYVVERTTGKVRELSLPVQGTAIDPRFSPDGRYVACAIEGDLYVISTETGRAQRLTSGATATRTHGTAEFVAQEEMHRMRGYWWSPDSRSIAYQVTDTSAVEQWYLSDPVHPERPPQPWRYPRPGRANADVRLGILPITGGETTWIEWDRAAFPYLAEVTWSHDGPLSLLVQNRTQNDERLLTVNLADGRTSERLRETDEAWINLDEGLPHWLPAGEGFLWSTMRSGTWQLERRHADGRLHSVLTTHTPGAQRLWGIDARARRVYVASAENPTESRVTQIDLDDPTRVTTIDPQPAVQGALISSTSGLMVLTTSRLDTRTTFDVRNRDGAVVGQLDNRAQAPPFVPQVELTTVGTESVLHAAIIRPRNVVAGKRYPVIVNVYGGPHVQMVQAASGRYLLNQWFADQGYIVVIIDGRGTPGRGRDWERAIYGDFIQPALADQVRGLQALGAKYPELDLTRVGIYGWSFGGYFSAMAVMLRPDVFHAGIAGAPVVDWLDYDTHYTERYLGLPDAHRANYAKSNVLTYADRLSRPLLIIHGTADDNVYFLHSAKLTDALFRAGKPFEFLPLVGFTHMVPDPLVTERLNRHMLSFFQKQLLAPHDP